MFPVHVFFDTWNTILDRYHNHTNLLAMDLLNEPHGRAQWGSGDPSVDWNLFIESALPTFVERYPDSKFLMFVEGLEWGHTFAGYQQLPLRLSPDIQSRLVFSPHTYGRSVVSSTWVNKDSLYQSWDGFFGFLRTQYQFAVVPGEWGGRTDLDSDWMQLLMGYLKDRNMTDNFLWSLGPNSGDVQGLLLDDWTTLDSFKVSMMNQNL
jgi:endoglucanase